MNIKSIKSSKNKFQKAAITNEQMKTVKGGEDIIIEEMSDV